MALQRSRTSAGPPHGPQRPPPPWLAGAAIGLTILTMATGAMSLGATLAVGQASWPK